MNTPDTAQLQAGYDPNCLRCRYGGTTADHHQHLAVQPQQSGCVGDGNGNWSHGSGCRCDGA